MDGKFAFKVNGLSKRGYSKCTGGYVNCGRELDEPVPLTYVIDPMDGKIILLYSTAIHIIQCEACQQAEVALMHEFAALENGEP